MCNAVCLFFAKAQPGVVRAVTEGLRMELKSNKIRCTKVSPGALVTELPEGSSEEATRKSCASFTQIAIPSDSVDRAIAYTVEPPAEIETDVIVIHPTVQAF